MNRSYLSLFASALASAALCASAAPASAGTTAPFRGRNLHVQGVADASAVPQTFSSTSYADLTGASVSVTPESDPNTTGTAPQVTPTDYLAVAFTADVSKATATTGGCAVYINGAVLTSTYRATASAAGQNTISGTFLIPNTTTGTQTVKAQCKSADANALTVSNAQLTVLEIR